MNSHFLNAMNNVEVRPYLLGVPPAAVMEADKRIEFNGFILTKSAILTTFLYNLSRAFPERNYAGIIAAFYCFFIAQKLEWVNGQTSDQIIMASLLQDIGLAKVSEKLNGLPFNVLMKEHPQAFQTHPSEGLIMLQDIENIPERVRQIIYQHHECHNGQGFPNGIMGTRIYPPAKILALATAFAEELIKNPIILPVNLLKQFVTHRETIMRYDGDCVRALIQIFIAKKG